MALRDYRPHGPYQPALDPERCHESVPDSGRSPTLHQCQRRIWKERPEARRCRQHHPDTVAERQRAADLKYRRESYQRFVLPGFHRDLGRLAERLIEQGAGAVTLRHELSMALRDKPEEPGGKS